VQKNRGTEAPSYPNESPIQIASSMEFGKVVVEPEPPAPIVTLRRQRLRGALVLIAHCVIFATAQ
jgi:hypothetical protein